MHFDQLSSGDLLIAFHQFISYIKTVKLDEALSHIANQIMDHQWSVVLLAVSGGMDSICLADYFTQNQEFLGVQHLAIAHVHHGLREGSADLDAQLVQSLAEANHVPFFLKKLDGEKIKKTKGSLEEIAREARYEALENFAKELQEDFASSGNMPKVAIVTAHHGNDQAETLYLRLRRGVGLAGLQGIQSVRLLSENISLYRPFLNTTRKELLEYAQKQRLTWREDESNTDERFARNSIRHRFLPNLEKSFSETLHQLCKISTLAQNVYGKILEAADRVFVPTVLAQNQWPFEADFARFGKVLALDLKSLNAVMENRFRNEFGMTAGSVPEAKIVKPGAMSELFRLWLGHKGFRIPLREQGTTIPYPFLQRMQCKSVILEKCRHILWICDVSTEISRTTNPNNLYLGVDKFSDLAGQWRYRSKGDSLWPADEKIKARKLEQWLREQGVPQWMYDSLPLFANGSRVFFVAGIQGKSKKLTIKENKNDIG